MGVLATSLIEALREDYLAGSRRGGAVASCAASMLPARAH
jgi:hypothetical protein